MLKCFFENLLLGTDHELKNRYLHIDFDDWQQSTAAQSATDHIPKCQNGTLECTLEELALLRLLAEHPGFTQRELQEKTGRSLRTIKRTMIALQNKGYIQRTGANATENGSYWSISRIADTSQINKKRSGDVPDERS